MKHLIFIYILFLVKTLHAETATYTVVAKSGLSLRSEMNLNSPRLEVVPFGEWVGAIKLFREKTVTVENVDGFWVYVSFRKKRGYMFSGYLFPGAITIYKKPENSIKPKYSTIDEFGEMFNTPENGNYQFLNLTGVEMYKYWYGVKLDSLNMTCTEVKLNFNISPKKVQSYYDSLDSHLPEIILSPGKPMPFENEIIPHDIYGFFIGSDEKLLNIIPSNYMSEGTFLYPWKNLVIPNSDYHIQAKGKIGQLLNYKLDTLTDIKYVLDLKHSYSDSFISIPTYSDGLEKNIEFNIMARAPRIIWSGDINNDSIPDLIISPNVTTQKCSDAYLLMLISEEKDNQGIYHQISFNPNSLNSNY